MSLPLLHWPGRWAAALRRLWIVAEPVPGLLRAGTERPAPPMMTFLFLGGPASLR